MLSKVWRCRRKTTTPIRQSITQIYTLPYSTSSVCSTLGWPKWQQGNLSLAMMTWETALHKGPCGLVRVECVTGDLHCAAARGMVKKSRCGKADAWESVRKGNGQIAMHEWFLGGNSPQSFWQDHREWSVSENSQVLGNIFLLSPNPLKHFQHQTPR